MGRHARAPLTGYWVDEASQSAYWDAWVETHAQITLRPLVPVSGMVLRGRRPIDRPAPGSISPVNGESAGAYPIGGGSFRCRVRPSRHLRDTFSVSPRRAAALTGPRLPVRDRSWFGAALFPPRSDGSRPFPPSRERRHSNSAPRAPIRPGWRRAFRSPRG